jgi:hypothetical protein
MGEDLSPFPIREGPWFEVTLGFQMVQLPSPILFSGLTSYVTKFVGVGSNVWCL